MTASRVVTAVSPDSTYGLLTSFIESANESLIASVYQLDNFEVGAALERAIIQRKVKVTLLLEGAPIPKLPQAELYIASRLSKLGARVYFYDRSKEKGPRTFKYLHAKYAVADGRRAIVGSSNYGAYGHPRDSSYGNREWEIVLDDRRVADLFLAALRHDLALENEWELYGSSERYTVDPDYEPAPQGRKGKYEPRFAPMVARDVQVRTVFAPDNSLSRRSSMLSVLAGARETIDIEQLNFETYWGDKPYNREPEDSPMMNAILDRARNGTLVRVLLNNDDIWFEPREFRLFRGTDGVSIGNLAEQLMDFGASFFSATAMAKPPRDNAATARYLNQLARREGLSLAVRLFDYRNCGLKVLHNKGMVVDGQVTLVSSLNWGESAMKFNREAGVLVRSVPVARYYSRAFEYDWRCSE